MSLTKEYLEAKYGKVLNEDEFNREYGFKIMIDGSAITSKNGRQVSCFYQESPPLYYDFKEVSLSRATAPVKTGGDGHLPDNG